MKEKKKQMSDIMSKNPKHKNQEEIKDEIKKDIENESKIETQPNSEKSTEANAVKNSQKNEDKETSTFTREHALELHEMTRKQRRQFQREEELAKLKELSFWRKIQYILNYYTWKFLAVVAVILIIFLIGRQIYIATRPVALDIALVNDPLNTQFEDTVIDLFSAYREAPDDALYLVDINYEIHPQQAYTSKDMAYYSKMMSAMTKESTHIIICEPDVIDYYAIDGFMMELYYALPEDLFAQVQDRLYECEGPVPDSDYYAIDISGMKFTEQAGIQLEQPYLCIPAVLTGENREIAYDFIRMVLEMEE